MKIPIIVALQNPHWCSSNSSLLAGIIKMTDNMKFASFALDLIYHTEGCQQPPPARLDNHPYS